MLERELKLAAPPGFRLPELEATGLSAGPARVRKLVTVYHDTPDLRLARWGVSLRHRGGEGWTVKLPAAAAGVLLARPEHVFPGSGRRPPGAALDLLHAYLRGDPVSPVACLCQLRRSVDLLDASGAPVAQIVDDEVSVMDGRRVAARFRELEVELAPGSPDAVLDPVAETLLAAGAGASDQVPKHVRALGPRASAPPEVSVGALAPDATAAEAIRLALAASVARLLRHDAGIRLGGDPEDIHQARVATRRLRSDLRSFAALLDPEWAASLREELGWLGGRLARTRDAEVQLDRLRARIALLPAADARLAGRLAAGWAAELAEARAELLVALRSDRYTCLLRRLVAAAAAPATLPAAEGRARELLPALAAAPWRTLRRGVRGLAPDPDAAALHEVRLLVKRARYAVEAVAPVAGRRSAELAAAMAGLQTVLGEHQDAVVAEARLRRDAAHAGRRTAFIAGELAGSEQAAALAARRSWPGAWRRVSARRLSSWLVAAAEEA